ncbi:MAG: LTA synthase family protein [Oscillospiraceae bacterium]
MAQEVENGCERSKKRLKPRMLKRLKRTATSNEFNTFFSLFMPLYVLVTLEWIARGTLAGNKQNNGFFQALARHFPSFLISFLFLFGIYVFLSRLTGRHWPAALAIGILGYLPAIVTHYKLTLRGEPFLPWDISQVGDLMEVSGNLEFEIPVSIAVSLSLFLVLFVFSFFVKFSYTPAQKVGGSWWKRVFWGNKKRLFYTLSSLALCLLLLFGIFLNPTGTALAGIAEDMWMQDRYYRTNGVITGFLTNLQMLQIDKPEGYSEETVAGIEQQIEVASASQKPYYSESYAATADVVEQTPDIIYVMAESFWDVTALEGIEYDQEIIPNLTALRQEAAYGNVYSPSFGGGTCDVEFEALTGFSMEHLPAGSKAFQQYVTADTFSLPQYLKSTGYDTLAIHGYGRRFWNRDQAYPRLGIDEFYASDDFVNPDKRRGFISDDAMVDKIIEQYEQRSSASDPMFIHAVTMQNHTTYNRNKYPEDELVKVVSAPSTISDSVIGQLEDCATGIREMDAAIGKLVSYLRTSSRPTILVFWGDHMNPMSDGYSLFEETGFIEKGDTASPELHKTPLLVWSNYSTNSVDLGVVASYNISPVMMDLLGLEKPLLFEFLIQQMDVMHARTRGITVNADNSTSEEMTEQQQQTFSQHAILQYDFLFGDHILEDYTPEEE